MIHRCYPSNSIIPEHTKFDYTMKTTSSTEFHISIISLLLSCILASCGATYYEAASPLQPTINNSQSQIKRKYSEEPLRILAIGNSFTHNASNYIPFIIDSLNADSVYMAKLTRSGCSLAMHWNSHCSDTPDYDFHYSDKGKWYAGDIKTIDSALELYDWDIIVIQQASGDSGIFDTYQPYLDNLIQLFRVSNPNAKLAWHYTWPYRDGTTHDYFARYDRDPKTMYDAIIQACDMASEGFDIKIPSATLIWEMRQKYPEVENQFSTDGYHISDPLALYALSVLWYECLIRPECDTSALTLQHYPSGIDARQLERALEIIGTLVGNAEPGGTDSVPMLFE